MATHTNTTPKYLADYAARRAARLEAEQNTPYTNPHLADPNYPQDPCGYADCGCYPHCPTWSGWGSAAEPVKPVQLELL